MNSIVKNSLGIMLIMVLTASGFSQPGQWVLKDSIKGPGKYGCVAFSIDGTGYLGTGYDNNDYKRSLFSYNPWLDDWDKVESLGGINGTGLGRNMAVGFVVSGKAYVGTGQGNASFFGDFWEYDPSLNSWQILLGVGMSSRRAAVSFTIDTIAYIGTGYDALGLKQDFWKFDPSTNTWTQIANFGGTARQKAVAATMREEGYVGLGDDGVLKNDFWKYNPGFNVWSQIQNFPGGARSGACGFAVNDDVYIGTGQDLTSYKKDFYQYNFWNQAWVQIQDFGDTAGTPRAYASAFSIGGIGYVGAGYDGAPKDDFYSFETVVGIDEAKIPLLNSTIYPNPLQKSTTISLMTDLKGAEVSLIIYDINGRDATNKIRVTNKKNVGGVINISIENTGLDAGQYVYRILNQSNTISIGKFLVIQ